MQTAVLDGAAKQSFDAQLRIRSAVSDFDAYVDLYKTLSAETRRLVPNQLDIAYGSSRFERLDVFLPSSTARERPVHVFFHGGYWRAFDKSDYSYLARPIVEADAVAVIVNYGLMPAVSMTELLTECRAAVRWVHVNAAEIGGNPERISLSGHSAGGHIASLLHLTRWDEHGLPADLIKTTVAVSGIYDLAPVLNSFLAAETGLSEQDAGQFSPLAWTDRASPASPPLCVCVGAEETDEFKRQSQTFAAALSERGAPVEFRALPGRHHMNVVLDLGDAGSELGQLLIARIMTGD